MTWLGHIGVILAIWTVVEIAAFAFQRWIAGRQPPQPPECCGSDPGPQARAENDCSTCPWDELCAQRSIYTRRQRNRDAARTSRDDPFIPVSLRRDD